MRSTPWVEGCCGPMLRIIRSPLSPSTSSRMSPASTVGRAADGGAALDDVGGAEGVIAARSSYLTPAQNGRVPWGEGRAQNGAGVWEDDRARSARASRRRSGALVVVAKPPPPRERR